MSSENELIHCFVSGRVQGVCFRASTRQQAISLGLAGWVRNLPDGRVEVFAGGKAQDLATFRQWLQHGPSMAKVDQIEIDENPSMLGLDSPFSIR